MRELFRDHPDAAFIVASFASHLHRVRAGRPRPRSASGRQIAFLGRSMVQNVTLAREMGLLDVPAERVIDIEEAPRFAPGEVCIICTGSQGEPISALSLMAAHEHKCVKVSEDDVVVISAHAIPGNEANVVPRHRRAVPRRRRGRPRRRRAGARVRPRVAGRAEVHAEPRAARVVRPGARRVPPHGPPRPPRRAVGVGRRPRRRLRGRRRRSRSAPTASTSSGGRCRPATSTSTGSSATSATACCATAAASPRRASSS